MEEQALAPFGERNFLADSFLQAAKEDPNVKALVYDFISALERVLAYNEGREEGDKIFLLADGIIRNIRNKRYGNLEFRVLNIPLASYALPDLPLVGESYSSLMLATQMLLSSSTMGVARMGTFPRVRALLSRRDIAQYLTAQLEEAFISHEEWGTHLERLKQEQEILERRRREEEEARRREAENLAGQAAARALALAEGMELPEDVPEEAKDLDVIFTGDILRNENVVKINPIEEIVTEPVAYVSHGPYQGMKLSNFIEILAGKIPGGETGEYKPSYTDYYIYMIGRERMLRFDYSGNINLVIPGRFDAYRDIIFVRNSGEFLTGPPYTRQRKEVPLRLHAENGEPTETILNIDIHEIHSIYAGSNFYVMKSTNTDNKKLYFYNRKLELERILVLDGGVNIHGVFTNDAILLSQVESGLFYILNPDLTLAYTLDLGIERRDLAKVVCTLIEVQNQMGGYDPFLYCEVPYRKLRIYSLDTKDLPKSYL